jgi:CRP/FNR family transcriptional regulator
MTGKLEQISEAPLFHSLSERERSELAQLGHSRKYLAQERIVLHGDVWPYFFMVESGLITAVKESMEGRSLTVLNLTPGDIFWGLAFFIDDAQMPVSLVALEESRVLVWSREALLPRLLARPDSLWELCRLMVSRMERASEIVEGLAFHPVAGRLAGLLLEEFGGHGESPSSRDLTLDEMAARVGTTSEVVCRMLYRFSDQEMINITRTEIAITDEDGLSQLAGRA